VIAILNKKDLLILIIPLIIAGILYFMLPNQIPRQIGLNGEIRYARKEIIFIFGLLPFLIYRKYANKK